MDNWFASSEQFIKDNLAWFIVLAILLGAVWGVWSGVIKEVKLNAHPDSSLDSGI